MSDLQLKSIIERILRLHAEEDEIKAAITSSDDRHRYVLGPLFPLLGMMTPPATRAFTAAGRMLGCSTDGARHRAAIWRRRGSFDAAWAWRIDLCGEPWPVCELPDGCVGFVYLLEVECYPGLFKVGFSRSPEDRADRLSRDFASPLRLRAQWPATWVDEHLAHVALHRFAMANEWFDASGAYAGQLPVARFYTPARMWSELKSKEAA
ncbi:MULTISPECIES: GIY-YIG nuclease family protein [unclassified Bosea (in: a-proteobacteria)]|uniref:GIY-YIG nuclease family protein n=1 Tax=unclassified Bosea (in: a-proteobacteria) TaxID=2653178 RepID=UPI000F74C1B5|nr:MULTISPECIES: GIY-YIG nuclease family protein [unclassified Bosea (in: a-proteobacteria)]AZO77512.1 hypothetical protein BLM15_07705 [Bosea sp. Tri-49]RXT18120.1 hypothetical protein B5U98_22870 [Bosea sp. Tri-39]RXT32717.1 hypothetical protein B5U99_29215 [Bosea sp. Tri-54]